MSYGTYDNQSPLNQPFNPTANTDIGANIGRSIGNSIATGLFGENAQGPLSSVTRELPAMMGRAVYNNLPGAPSPEARQNVERSQAGGGILKLRQQPPMLGQQPGGKSGKSGGVANPGGGGKYATGGPAIESPGFEEPEMPSVDYRNFQSNLPGTPLWVNAPDVNDGDTGQITAQNNFYTGY